MRELLAEIHDDLAFEETGLDRAIGFAHGLQREPARGDPWGDFPGVNELRRFPKASAVMLAALAGQKRKQRQHTRIGRGAERQRRQRMRSLSERARSQAEPTDDGAALKALEDAVGQKLFQRSSEGFVLADEGSGGALACRAYRGGGARLRAPASRSGS